MAQANVLQNILAALCNLLNAGARSFFRFCFLALRWGHVVVVRGNRSLLRRVEGARSQLLGPGRVVANVNNEIIFSQLRDVIHRNLAYMEGDESPLNTAGGAQRG